MKCIEKKKKAHIEVNEENYIEHMINDEKRKKNKMNEDFIIPFKAKGVLYTNTEIFESIFEDIYIYDYNENSKLFKAKKKNK